MPSLSPTLTMKPTIPFMARKDLEHRMTHLMQQILYKEDHPTSATLLTSTVYVYVAGA
jgi:hypothetical protein